MPDQQTRHHPLPAEDATPLGAVRRRGAFLITAVLWAAAAGGIAVMAGYFVAMVNLGMDAGERVRQALGLQVPATGPDWYLIAVLLLIVAMPAGGAGALWLWYRRIWRRRLRQVWTQRSDMQRHSRIRRLPLQAGPKDLQARSAYLEALLASPPWQGFTPDPLPVHPEAVETPAAQDGAVHAANDYRRLAEEVLREIEEDVAERAIATGLIVGLGPSRLDRATIVIAALEMQLHVLSRLGKKPSLGTWAELVKRTSASFFFNTYLNREDTLLISFAIRNAALGLAMTAELGQSAADALSDAGDDMDDAMDEAMDGIGGIPMAGSVLQTVGAMSLTLSARGLQAISDLTREAGNELLQGALAGGVLYYHGMAIAADALALDEAHRHSPAMTRTPREGARRTAAVAGQFLRDQVRRYRRAYRQRQRAPLRMVGRAVPRWPFSRGRRPQTGTGTTADPAPDGTATTPDTPPRSSRRRRPFSKENRRPATDAPAADGPSTLAPDSPGPAEHPPAR